MAKSSGIRLILIEPENPGNTGAILRSMKNFDFDDILLIHPQFDIGSEELRNRAKWAGDLIKKIKVWKRYDLKKLRKEHDYLVASTARIGRDYNVLRSPITPEQLGQKVLGLKDARIGIMIGREGIGLNNEEVKMADFTLTIPTSKRYGTMNISHATAIILYEIFRSQQKESIISHITPISEAEKTQLLKILDSKLKSMYFATEEKRETQRIVWKKLIGKSFLSKREAYALMGFLKKIK